MQKIRAGRFPTPTRLIEIQTKKFSSYSARVLNERPMLSSFRAENELPCDL